MNVIATRNLSKWLLPGAALCLSLVGPVRSARAANESAISGTLSTHLVSCATLCTSGTISGSLSGQFDYTMATMTATPDPNVVILTGSFVVTTATGTVTGTDTTLWDVSTGVFTDIGRFRSGTGAYANAEGKITILGNFDIVAGTGQSNYTGKIETD
jgi:hypothetical protein